LRQHLFPHLVKTGTPEIIVKEFLKKCYYYSGKTYGDEVAYASMVNQLVHFETDCSASSQTTTENQYVANRLFYLAVPPNVFGESGTVIKMLGMSSTGWTRLVIEKPFGHDLDSCNELLQTLSEQFDEDNMYRIDHYLGKEVVQNLLMFRFGNSFFETIWNNQTMESVTLTFKEVCS
jgi:glucose-6-phosphate 1-dehydrogenase